MNLRAELAAWNFRNARARLHYRCQPISSTGIPPLCAHECGRHVPYARIGEPCRYCVEAEKTRKRT